MPLDADLGEYELRTDPSFSRWVAGARGAVSIGMNSGFTTVSVPNVVPEPGAFVLVGFAATGLGGVGLIRHRRWQKKESDVQ